MKKIRLDKYLAEMSVGTRSQVKQMIRKGLVFVNDEKITKPEFKVSIDDQIIADGTEVSFVAEEYILLHKPAGVVSATKDTRDRTVLDLIENQARKDLFPVGRLDKDTEGLLLLTNDGALAHELLSPKKHVDKTYYAKIEGEVTSDDQEAFWNGLNIGEKSLTMPAKLEILKSDAISEIEVTIQEGKFHQVKRMFEAVNKKVIYLKRISFGPLTLDEDLKKGEYRALSEHEIKQLKGEANE